MSKKPSDRAVRTTFPRANAKCRMGPGRTPDSALRTRRSALAAPHSRGFTYVALLAAIVILGILLGSAGKYWQNVMLREREEELLFRGGQYRQAIERYYFAKGPNSYPQNIDDLLVDSRSAKGTRHLRQPFKDPITGKDFELLRDPVQGNRIIGVFSKSEDEPLRQTGFPEEYKDFEGKKKYNEWKFVFMPQQQQQQRSVRPYQRLQQQQPLGGH